MIELTDILESGVLVKRVYGVECELRVWHFAYNDGGEVCLFRGSEGGMEESFGYWRVRFSGQEVPVCLVDVGGVCYERRWYPLRFGS